jgi:hypothetical protein
MARGGSGAYRIDSTIGNFFVTLFGKSNQWNLSSHRRPILTHLQQLLTPPQCLNNRFQGLESLHPFKRSDLLDWHPAFLFGVRLCESPEIFVQWEVCVAEIEFDLFEDFSGIAARKEDGYWVELVFTGTFGGRLTSVGTGEVCGRRRRAFCGGDCGYGL